MKSIRSLLWSCEIRGACKVEAWLTLRRRSGLGAGLIARSLEQYNVSVTIVEIDDVVFRHAAAYFGVEEPSGGVFLEDARAFVERETARVSLSVSPRMSEQSLIQI